MISIRREKYFLIDIYDSCFEATQLTTFFVSFTHNKNHFIFISSLCLEYREKKYCERLTFWLTGESCGANDTNG